MHLTAKKWHLLRFLGLYLSWVKAGSIQWDQFDESVPAASIRVHSSFIPLPVFEETGRISSRSRPFLRASRLRVRSLPLRRSILVATTAKLRPAARSQSIS